MILCDLFHCTESEVQFAWAKCKKFRQTEGANADHARAPQPTDSEATRLACPQPRH